MYKDYKVVVNTAAGRRRYMQYLIPFIVASDIVDRYDIWVNTHNMADIEFFKRVAEKYPVINLVWQPEGVVNGIASINAFYKGCVEEKTIYFKLDDDIVWMEPDLIEKMVKFRVENPKYFVVSPLVINNSLSTYLLQLENKIQLDRYYNSESSHPILWKSGKFASDLHSWFMNNHLKTGDWSSLYIGKKEMGMTRFSINSILWFGEEMKNFGGVVPGDDEEYLSCIYPTMKGMSNAWNGDAVIAHFAFFTQREELDKKGILEQYGEYLFKMWEADSKMKKINKDIQEIISFVSEHEIELLAAPSPYRKIEKPVSLRSRIKKIVPKVILEQVQYYKKRKSMESDHILG